MGIREMLYRAKADLIGLGALLRRMTEAEGVTFQEAAEALSQLLHQADPMPAWRVYTKTRGVIAPENGCATAWSTLRMAVYAGAPEILDSNSADYRRDLTQWGFRRDEIFPLLTKHGIQFDATLPPAWPAWKILLISLPALSLQQWASAFAGVNLGTIQIGNATDHEISEYRRWSEILQCAIDADELKAHTQTSPTGSLMSIRDGDLASWCAINGFEYPLPRLAGSSMPIAAQNAALEALRAEIAELRLKESELARLLERDELLERGQLTQELALKNCQPAYLDTKHPRYAPKLAAAVRAWEAVTEVPNGSTAKREVEEWIRKRHVELGMSFNGKPNNEGIRQCGSVANWNVIGGAPKTPGN
jgi:hypothetical protein